MSVFHGVGAAMITPFDSDGVNFDAFGSMIEYLIDGKIDSLIVCGTTGEPATMTADERRAAIAFAVEKTGGRVPVIAGCGCNSTAETVANARAAQSLGADALLVVTPYYNKCTQNGLVAHYTAVAEAVDIPVIVYNVPSRTGVNLLPSTMLRLSEVKNIVGIKETIDNVGHIRAMISTIKPIRPEFSVLAGYDDHLLNTLELGGDGSITASMNFAPELSVGIYEAFKKGDYQKAVELDKKLVQLPALYGLEVPFMSVIKYATVLATGVEMNTYSLPPVRPLTEETKEAVKAFLAAKGVI